MVIKYLRTGPARAGRAHRPEIIGSGNADNSVIRQAGDFAPQSRRFFILRIDRDQQFILVQAKFTCNQRPGLFNRHFFEIITKGKIPQHFEKGVMPGGIAHIFQIIMFAARAHTFL